MLDSRVAVAVLMECMCRGMDSNLVGVERFWGETVWGDRRELRWILRMKVGVICTTKSHSR